MNDALNLLISKLADAGRTELALGMAVGYYAAEIDLVKDKLPTAQATIARLIAAISLVKIKQDTFLNDDILHQVGLTQADLQAAVKTLGTGNG